MSQLTTRIVRCANKAAEFRRETLQGREYLVVPVIALIGDVTVEASGSDGPEVVPADVLAAAASSWNGRAVTAGHPETKAGTANEPVAWEAYQVGFVFGTEYRNGKLHMEAWLDEEQARQKGGEAEQLVERVLAGDPIEVSVGAMVSTETVGGKVRWTYAEADHLALLPAHQIGACSREMGCGVRAAAAAIQTKRGADMETDKAGLRERFASAFKALIGRARNAAASQGQESDADVRDAIRVALERGSGANTFIYVEDVYADHAVFAAEFEGTAAWGYWRIGYAFDSETNTVELVGEPVEVMKRSEWIEKTVDAADAAKPLNQLQSAQARGESGQQDGAEGEAGGEPASTDPHGERSADMTAEVKALVGRLLAAKGTPWKPEDAEVLAQLGEQRLTELCGCAEKRAAEDAKSDEPINTADAGANAAGLVTLSADQLDQLVESAVQRRENQREVAHLAARLAKAQEAFTESDLAAKSVDELRALAKVLKIDAAKPDYSGLGIPTSNTVDTEDEDVAAFAPPVAYRFARQKEAN